ncbi:MAG TPA: hypothetical protein VFT59_02815 [Candidatus Saccharimonadales bacterium]|nr:hypothetical protein [Candidatus Saccharimonadales bacterium]
MLRRGVVVGIVGIFLVACGASGTGAQADAPSNTDPRKAPVLVIDKNGGIYKQCEEGTTNMIYWTADYRGGIAVKADHKQCM